MRNLRRYRACPQYIGTQMMDLNREELSVAIDLWIIGRNGERDREILKMYLFDGVTYAEMQRRLDNKYPLSIDQLKKIVRKRKAELFRHI